MLQILLLIIITCCVFIVAGIIWLFVLRHKIKKVQGALEQGQGSQEKLSTQLLGYAILMICVLGCVLGLSGFTIGLFFGLGEILLLIPIGIAAPFFFWAWKVKQKGIVRASMAPNWMDTALTKKLHIHNYTSVSNFAEKSSLEFQAFGNECYMKSRMHLSASYKDISFEYYHIDIPDFFEGLGMRIDMPHAFAEKIFVISRDFPHSQLLKRSGLWKEVPMTSAEFNEAYIVFAKEPDHAKQVLQAQILASMACINTRFACSQSYYFEESSLYILLAGKEAFANCDEQQQRVAFHTNVQHMLHCIDSLQSA